MWTGNRRVPLGVLIHQSFLRDRISLCSSGWLGTLCRDLPASASWILGLETCTTIPGLFLQSWHVTKQRRLKESFGLLLPSSLLPQEALILKSSEKQALRGPCGDERQWPSRGLMGFSWYKCKFRAASSKGAMPAFSGRTWNKQVEHLHLGKEVEEKQPWRRRSRSASVLSYEKAAPLVLGWLSIPWGLKVSLWADTKSAKPKLGQWVSKCSMVLYRYREQKQCLA